MRWLLLILLLSACSNKCKSITDIYYYPPNVTYDFNKTERCKYTLTVLDRNTPTIRMNRKLYNYHRKEYEKKYNILFPYSPAINKKIFISDQF
jgi:hypothetical protein